MPDNNYEDLPDTFGAAGDSASADDIFAQLTRDQWSSYVNDYLPTQQRLIDLATSDELLTDQLARNQKSNQNSYRLADLNEQNRMGRYGLNAKSTQQSQNNKSLQQGLSLVSANNASRAKIDDLQTQIKTGHSGRPSLSNLRPQ